MAGFTDSLPVRFKKEKEKIKAFPTSKERWEYIWGYYKLHFLVIVILIFSITSMVNACIRNNFTTALSITYINLTSNDVAYETGELEKAVNELLEIDGKDVRTVVNTYFTINPEVYTEEAQASVTKLTAMVSIKECDVFLCDDIFMKNYATSNFFYPLDTLMSDELYAKAEGRFLYYTDEDGNDYLAGIDLSGLPFMTEFLVVSKEQPIFSVVRNAPNLEAAMKFLEYVLDYK